MIPTISVIVPVYNVEKYIYRCVDSILAQSFTNFELLLIDDGSPDNCGVICDEYAAKDARVRVFHKENGGVSSARNLGLDNAKGEWIAFIDSDDYVDVDYLSELVSYTQEYETDYVITLNIIKEFTTDKLLILKPNAYSQLFSCYNFHNNGCPWGKLYKTEIIKKSSLRFNANIHLGEDAMFALQYLIETRNIILIHSNKYFYETLNPGSLTKRYNSYESELAGKLEFKRIVDVLKARLTLDKNALLKLGIENKKYAERTLYTVMRLAKRSDRIKKLKELDLTQYNEYKIAASWREAFLLFLLRNKFFYLYDFLINIKR